MSNPNTINNNNEDVAENDAFSDGTSESLPDNMKKDVESKSTE